MNKIAQILILLIGFASAIILVKGNNTVQKFLFNEDYSINTAEGDNYSSESSLVREVVIQNNSISSSAFDLQNAFNTVAKVATGAVVSIRVFSKKKVNQYGNFFGNDEFLKKFFGVPKGGNPQTRQSEAFGSGFLISKEGYLLSNNHVIDGATEIKIRFKDNEREYTASVIGSDPDTDVALLKINEKGPFPYLKLGNSDNVKIGDIAIAIGNPFGLSHTFTTGVISAKGRTGIIGNKYENFIQTDVAINQGNSGGPLLNLNAEVIGINSAILSKSGGSIGIGFSIPINMAKSVSDQLRKTGKVTRGWIGIYFDQVSSDIAEALNVPKNSVLVAKVVEDSPADKAGIIAGDVLYLFEGKPIKGGSDLVNKIGSYPLGSKIRIGLIRNGKKIKLSIILESQKKEIKEVKENKIGISVRELTKKEKKDLRNKKPIGVVIIKIEQNSILFRSGIKAGDIVLSINKKAITSIKFFTKMIKKIKKGKKILFQIKRGDSIRYFVIRF